MSGCFILCLSVSMCPSCLIPSCPDLTKLVDCQWKKQPPKTKLSPPSPTANPYLSVMLVNVFRETYFGNESFFFTGEDYFRPVMKRDRNCMVHWWFYPERYVGHQRTVCTHTTHTHTQTLWYVGGSIQRGMWYISVQCTHMHTHNTHTHKLYGTLVVLSREVCGTSAYSVHTLSLVHISEPTRR